MNDLPYEAELELIAFQEAADDHFYREMVMVEQDVEQGLIPRKRGDILIAALKQEHDQDIDRHNRAILSKYS